MNDNIRKIVARYLEDPDSEISPDNDVSWSEYLQNKYEGMGRKPSTAIEMLEHADGVGDSFSTYNPYDYKNPSSHPKDMKDGPPFINEVFPEIDHGLFMVPSLFKDKGVLEQWNNSTEQDPTQVEEEQYPSISCTRKQAQEVMAGYLLERMPLFTTGYELNNLFLSKKVAATLTEIVSKDEHYQHTEKAQRVGQCQAVHANKGQTNQIEKGLFRYRVSCGGHPPHTVYFQFLRDEEVSSKLTYADYPVLVACTCPSFLWYGAQFYAVKDSYMYMPMFRPSYRQPVPQNMMSIKGPGKGLNFRVCKHIWAAYFQVKTMRIEKPFKRFPLMGPPSKVIDTDQWESLMKFEFTEQEFMKRLKSDKPPVPTYFLQEDVTPEMISWIRDIWMPRNDMEKIQALETMTMMPERIYFMLIKEAYLKRSKGERISNTLIHRGFEIMSRTIKAPTKEQPSEIADEIKDQVKPGQGTGAFPKGIPGSVPADQVIKETPEQTEQNQIQRVQNITQQVKSPGQESQ